MMLIFFTVLFLTYHLVNLVKGGFGRELLVEVGKETVKKQKVGADNYKEDKDLLIKVLMYFIPALMLAALQILYYCFSINSDPFLFPTLFMILHMVISIAYAYIKPKKTEDLTIERNAERYIKKLERKYKPKNVIIQLINVTYFAYMLFATVFMG
ncbi:hypothetical protein ABEY43_06035 [Priestia megaterium]